MVFSPKSEADFEKCEARIGVILPGELAHKLEDEAPPLCIRPIGEAGRLTLALLRAVAITRGGFDPRGHATRAARIGVVQAEDELMPAPRRFAHQSFDLAPIVKAARRGDFIVTQVGKLHRDRR